MNDFFRASNIHKEYEIGSKKLTVLKGINLKINEAEILTIAGASGAGKSTLLHVLGILDPPTKGKIIFKGEEITKTRETYRSKIRNELFGFVFQFYHLFNEFDALENVLLPIMIKENLFSWRVKKKKLKEKAKDVLEKVGLGDRINHKPNQLSGGEQQRVAIARSLINEPKILFCDEPTGNLDSKTSKEIEDLLWKLNKETNKTIVMVTHDEKIAEKAHRVIHIKDGVLS